LIPDLREVTYLVLTDRACPYLLARVRWPDVAQAITVGSPDWLDDPGLFDLPYDSSAVEVSFAQAASVAAGWDVQLHAEAADGVPSFIRRMPANWSALTPAERQVWRIDFVGRRRGSARRIRRLQSVQAKTAAGRAYEQVPALTRSGPNSGLDDPASNWPSLVTDLTNGLATAPIERRRHIRVRVDGTAHIRSGPATISAGLVDVSEGGLRCVQPEAPPVLAPGATLDGPFLLEADGTASRICLDVAGRIIWLRSIGATTHFGVAFGELAGAETEGLRSFLATAYNKRGTR